MKWEEWEKVIIEKRKQFHRKLKKRLRDQPWSVGNSLSLILQEISEEQEILASMGQDSDLSKDQRLLALQSRKGGLIIKEALKKNIEKFKKNKGRTRK